MAPGLKSLSKRKVDAAEDVEDDAGNQSDASSSSGSDVSFINVDFDFRSPSEIDEAALRRLLRQLFHTHANSLNLYDVSSAVIAMGSREEASLGTVIKVEGDEDQDPFAFASAIRLGQDDAASKLLTAYFLKQLPASSPIADVITRASTPANPSRPYVFLHERFINLPAQTAPPLYRMLTEEVVAAAQAQGQDPPTHVLFLSRVFSQDAYSDDEDESMPSAANADGDDEDTPRGLKGAKRRRKAAAAAAAGGAASSTQTKARPAKGDRLAWGHFRPEDIVLERKAAAPTTVAKAGQAADAKVASTSGAIDTYRFPPPQEAEESYESPLYGRVIMLDWTEAGFAGGKLWDEMEQELGAP